MDLRVEGGGKLDGLLMKGELKLVDRTFGRAARGCDLAPWYWKEHFQE